MYDKSIIFLGSTDYAIKVFNELANMRSVYNFYIICENTDSITKIQECCHFLPKNNIFTADKLEDDSFLKFLSNSNPILALSVNFMKILKGNFFELPKNGTLNIHPGYLPYNRGNWPEFWSIINKTLSGVTIHYIDKTIDTGPIIAQRNVKVENYDTGESLCIKVEEVGVALIKSLWIKAINTRLESNPQSSNLKFNNSESMYNSLYIDLEKYYKAEYLIDLLRAGTMPDFIDGPYFIDRNTGAKIFINITLKPEIK